MQLEEVELIHAVEKADARPYRRKDSFPLRTDDFKSIQRIGIVDIAAAWIILHVEYPLVFKSPEGVTIWGDGGRQAHAKGNRGFNEESQRRGCRKRQTLFLHAITWWDW